MFGVTERYLDAIRESHVKKLRVSHTNLYTGAVTILADEMDEEVAVVTDGQITVDSTSNIRRRLDLTIPGSETLWQALDTVGGEITVTRCVDFQGSLEWAPLGVFIVDTDNIDYGVSGSITVTGAPDRWGKVQKNRLLASARSSVAANQAWQEIQRLVEGAWPGSTYPFPGWALLDSSASEKVGYLLWDDGDRDAAILSFCADNGVEAFFNASGKAVLRPVPTLSGSSLAVWTVDAGVDGVMLGASRSRDRTRVFNAIEVTTAATDVTFLPVVRQNTTAGDPMNVSGPLGVQLTSYSSGSLRNSAQAIKAGDAILAKYTGAAKQLSLTALQNDALTAGDVIEVILPKVDDDTVRPSELHMVDTITLPLTPQGAMEIQTRSTVPDTVTVT